MMTTRAQALTRAMERWRLRRVSQTGAVVTKNLTAIGRDRRGRLLFLKCAPNPFDDGLAREAAVLGALAACGLHAPRTPELVGFDAQHQVLALRLIPRTTNLLSRLRGTRKVQASVFREVGGALAALHGAPVDLDAAWATPPETSLLACFVWTPPEFATRLSVDGMELIGHVQGRARARDALVELVQGDEARALVHGDAKMLNVLVRPRSTPVLLDWELAHRGDPAEDLGSLQADLLRCQLAPDDRAESLDSRQVRTFISALRAGYTAVRGRLGASASRRVRLWTGASLLVHAHALVLREGYANEGARRLLAGALAHLEGGQRG